MSERGPGSSDVYQEYSEFYDLYVGDRRDDLPMYMDHAARSSSPVLEIGAGSGRLTIPLASEGYRVVAVDISPSMLAILEAKLEKQPADVRSRVRIVQSDVCRLDLGETYDLVIVPFYTFNYLLTAEVQREALRRIRSHMDESGRLILDVYIPVRRIAASVDGAVPRVDMADPSTGSRVRSWNTYQVDVEARTEHITQRWEVTRSDGLVQGREFSVVRRHFLPGELERLVISQGFEVLDVFTGYRGEAPSPSSEQLVYTLGLG